CAFNSRGVSSRTISLTCKSCVRYMRTSIARFGFGKSSNSDTGVRVGRDDPPIVRGRAAAPAHQITVSNVSKGLRRDLESKAGVEQHTNTTCIQRPLQTTQSI